MGHVIAVFNRKGGVGKTTSCVNLGAVFASMGRKVLLIDGDSQRNLTQFFFENNDEYFEFNDEIGDFDIKDDVPTLLDVLYGDVKWKEAVQSVKYGFRIRDKKTRRFKQMNISVDVMPANLHLDYYNGEDENALCDAAKQMRLDYDYILIDFPPTYNFLTVTYLVACDYIIVPMHLAKDTSNSGYRDVLLKCREVRETYNNKNLKILGTFYSCTQTYKSDQKSMLDLSMTPEVKQAMMFFNTVVRYNYKPVQDSEAEQRPLICGSNTADVTNDYKALAKEIEKRIKGDVKNGKQ